MADDKFQYFIEQTNKRLDSIDDKLEQLISFRIMLIGASVGVSGLATVLFNLVLVFIKS